MLTIQLNGGLGNQLFQYALGKSLSDKHDIRYDISNLSQASTARTCELNLFQTKADFGSYPLEADQKILAERHRYHTITDKLYLPARRYQYHQLNIQDDMYIQGFWQSYKYFNHIKEALLQDLQSTIPLDEYNQTIIKTMHSQNSVAIHIRRGDFQQKKISTLHLKGFHRHTIIPLSYYHQAITEIKTSVSDPVFYIFSNDINWCKDQFTGSEYIFVDHNTGMNSYKDLILMSQCKHNIICNSTFSRRGAYLNQTPGQIVICPKKWYDVNINVKDLLLPHWTRL